MKFIEKLELIERLAYLIDRKATGSPRDLAIKLRISKRHVHNIILEMRKMGGPINYCARRRTYYFTKNVHFTTGFIVKENLHLQQRGQTGFHSGDYLPLHEMAM